MATHGSNSEQADLERVRILCRVCLHSRGVINLFSNSMLEKLLACTDMQIHKNDGLPDSLCPKCEKNLDQAFQFRVQCTESDKRLQRLLTPEFSTQGLVKDEFTENDQRSHMYTGEVEYVVIKTEVQCKSYTESICDPDSMNDGPNPSEKFEELGHNEDNVFANENLEQEEFPTDERITDCPPPKEFSCHFCYQVFNDRKIHREHIKQHKSETYECDVCSKVFWGTKNIERHKNSHIKSKSHPCQFCGLMFDKYRLKTHIQEKHLFKKKECPICKQRLSSTSLRAHIERHGDLNVMCEICSKTFKTRIGLRDHLKIHLQVRAYKCSFCEKRFNNRRGKTVHERLHTGVKPYKCPLCEKAFAQRPGITSHIKSRHREYVEEYKRQEELMRTAAQEAPIAECPKEENELVDIETQEDQSILCEICNKTLPTTADLRVHLKSHFDTKWFPCSYCDKTFGFLQARIVHERTHTGFKPYECPLCDKTFAQQSGVIGHFKSRHKDYNYSEMRKKGLKSESVEASEHFQSNMGASAVIVEHITEKPIIPEQTDGEYPCGICPKTFNSKALLNSHVRTHSEMRPFPCSYCDKSFSYLQARIVHERLHTGIKPCKCPLCEKCFTQQAGVVSHFRNRHKGHDYTAERRKQKEAARESVEASEVEESSSSGLQCDATWESSQLKNERPTFTM